MVVTVATTSSFFKSAAKIRDCGIRVIREIRGQEMIYEKLSGSIIGAAMTVLNELRPGLDEKLYENALVIELRHFGPFCSAAKAVSCCLS